MEANATQGEPADLAPAPIGPRFWAALIDLAVAVAPFAFIYWSDLQWGGGGFLQFNVKVSHPSFLQLMVLGWGLFYFFAKDGWSGGGSVGKKAFGLRVVDVQTRAQSTYGASAIRALILWSLPLIEPIFLLADSGHRRLGDRAAGTIVVQRRPDAVVVAGAGAAT